MVVQKHYLINALILIENNAKHYPILVSYNCKTNHVVHLKDLQQYRYNQIYLMTASILIHHILVQMEAVLLILSYAQLAYTTVVTISAV